MTSRILGLARDIAMAALFERRLTDAWTVAFRIPNLFRRLFGEGSLGIGFIPLFIDLRVQDSTESRARNLLNGFYALLLVVLGTVTLGSLFGMRPLLGLLLEPSYVADATRFELTLSMARIMMGFVFFVVGYAYFMGILHALGEFGWPAFAPVLFNLTMLVFIFLPEAWFSFHGAALAWGVLAGGVLQGLLLVPILRRRHYFPKFQWIGWTSDLRLLLRRLFFGVLGIGLLQILTLVNMRFASGMGEGVLSALYWADRLLELPLSLVSVSLSATLLPRLAELWSRGERQKIFAIEGEKLGVNGFWIIPCAVGLFALAGPIVEVLFFRGQFQQADLVRTTAILEIYALSLVVLSLTRVLLTLLYASHCVALASLCSLVALLAHVFLAPLWIAKGGFVGMMWSTFFSLALNLLLVAVVIVSTMGIPPWGKWLSQYLQFALLSSVLFLCAPVFEWGREALHSRTLSLAIAISLGGGFYFFLGRLFRVHEMFHLRKLFSMRK